MQKKLFFFDVDGTLVDDETKIVPQSTLDAIRALKKRGHLVFLNSGRTLCFLEYQMETFGVDCAVCGCGTQVIVSGNTIFEKRISYQRNREIRRALRKLKVDAILEAQEGIYFSDRPFLYPEIMEDLLEYAGIYAETEVNALEDNSYEYDKVCVQTNPLFPERNVLDQLMKAMPDFSCIDRGRGFYEFVPLGCSKGSAVHQIQTYYGIRPEDTYVFGDSANDLTMFMVSAGAGNRIIMGDHDSILEHYATFTTKKVLDGGISYALHALGVL